jgi:hypothetical protein
MLLAVLTWRLLLPPGVCLCQLIYPAAGVLARLLGNEPPAPEPEDESHHQHGCPASRLGPSLRPQPPQPPAPPGLSLDGPVLADLLAAAPAEQPLPSDHPFLTAPAPLFLTLCALRI